jgi:hypothetical protein
MTMITGLENIKCCLVKNPVCCLSSSLSRPIRPTMLSSLFWSRLSLLCLATAELVTSSSSRDGKPNFVFIITDDQDLHLGSMDYMPLTRKHLGKQGSFYSKHYCTISICCPSRVSLLTGKAAHNTNVTDVSPPHGKRPCSVWIEDFSNVHRRLHKVHLPRFE